MKQSCISTLRSRLLNTSLLKFSVISLSLAIASISYSQITFQEVLNTPFLPVYESSIAIADIDNDFDNDLLITGRFSGPSHVSELYLNDGSANFSLDITANLAGASNSSVAFADIDSDNDMDLLITGQNSGSPLLIISHMYTNDPVGNFSLATGTPFSAAQNSSVAFADVDGNNSLDLVITGDGGGTNYLAELYLNNGTGNYTQVPSAFTQGVRYSSIAFADVDGDNDKDLLITGLEYTNPGTVHVAKLYINNGLGVFTLAMSSPFQGVAYSSVAFADVDGDNDQDVVIAGGTAGSGKSATLYVNDGFGNFSISTQPFTPVDKASIAFSDVDGDNDFDLLICGESGSQGKIAKLFENDGAGNFSLVGGLPFIGVGNGSVAFADLNGDLKPDLVITGENAGSTYVSKLYLNTSLVSLTENPALENSISIYPNPSSSDINIKFSGPILNTAGQISVFDSMGKLIQQQSYDVLPENIHLNEFENGVYNVVFIGDDFNSSSRVVVLN